VKKKWDDNRSIGMTTGLYLVHTHGGTEGRENSDVTSDIIYDVTSDTTSNITPDFIHPLGE
jgi:hypothetical protein